MISSASAGVGTPPARAAHLRHAADADEGVHRADRLRRRRRPRATIWPPTTNDEPGRRWSTPEGSKITPSYAQRIGQSTFQTSLPRLNSVSSTVSVCPQRAGVGQLGGVVVVGGDGGDVASADGAVRLVREVARRPEPSRRPRSAAPEPSAASAAAAASCSSSFCALLRRPRRSALAWCGSGPGPRRCRARSRIASRICSR